jgi:hypothetical protein
MLTFSYLCLSRRQGLEKVGRWLQDSLVHLVHLTKQLLSSIAVGVAYLDIGTPSGIVLVHEITNGGSNKLGGY